ncbi:uncharacterized protein LOC131298621 [Rhododendron vialii]|uniref:uncharacterized protein LOC131298621 n=1 Tax=Rhododendron vialii TaxID=182163 RepID=UPI00265FE363|nr:uncharacterized protein LOC131298621 [Rhododendron vialii]
MPGVATANSTTSGPFVLPAPTAGNPAGAHGKKPAVDGTSTLSVGPYITMVEVQALLTRQKALLTKEKAKMIMPSLPNPDIRPPYPVTILLLPYPEGYTPPKFVKFDGKEGSAQEHVVRFIESLRAHALDTNLRLREFSKSLTSRAYMWYVNLEPYSIATWEEMVNNFYAKFFQVLEKVTVISLTKEIQTGGEDVVNYIKRFQDYAVDCTESVKKMQLVEICIGGMMDECKMLLVNLKLGTFSALLESAYNIRHVVKPARKES